MKRLTALFLVGVILLWAGTAFAQYSALEEEAGMNFYVGAGGLLISGDNGSGDSDNMFIPTVNIGGVCNYIAWQAFYGFGSDTTAFGGSVDYILASNFDECFTCVNEEVGKWWFGAGGTLIDVDDLFYDSNDSTAAISDTFYGPNLGFGYMWGDWMFSLYAHYLFGDEDDQLGFQGQIMYNVN